MHQYLRKAKWTLIGIIAPEIVLYTAWTQFRSSRKFQSELRDILRAAPSFDVQVVQEAPCTPLTTLPTANASSKPEFHTADGLPADTIFDPSLEYCFFVVMGGFRLSTEEFHDDHDSLTLTPDGVLRLAQAGHVPKLSTADINDRSKADVLAKSLALLQLTWILINCIARTLAGLPVSLLELHTFVHAICALAIFSLWIKVSPYYGDNIAVAKFSCIYETDVLNHQKPLNVQQAHIISTSEGQALRQTTAEMLMRLCRKFSFTDGSLHYPDWYDEIRFISKYPPVDIDHSHEPAFKHTITLPDPLPATQVRRVVTGEQLPGGFWFWSPPHYTLAYHFSPKAWTRWETALSGNFAPMQWAHSGLLSRSTNFEQYGIESFYDFFGKIFLTSGIGITYPNLVPSVIALGSMFLVTAAYGGIHMAAWNYDFPTHAERLLWRIACIILPSFMPLCGSARYFDKAPTMVFGSRYSEYFLWLIIILVVSIFAAARIYIVVESVISIRHVPNGVYVMISWVNYIPHLF